MVLHRLILMIVLLLGIGASALQGGDISSTLQVQPQSRAVGAKTIHKITWTTVTPINAQGKIAVLYPTSFSLERTQLVMASTVNSETMNGALKIDSIRTVNISGELYRKVVMTRQGLNNNNGEGAVGVNLALVGNAVTPGTYKVRVETFRFDADPFTSVPSDSGSTNLTLIHPISTFGLTVSVPEPRAGESFALNVASARDADGNLSDGIITVSFETGTIDDHKAPDGSTLPVLVPIWVRNGIGSAMQTLYKAEQIKLKGTAESGAAVLTSNINVKPGALGSLDISAPPQTTVAGLDFGAGNNITVTAYDSWRNRKNDLVGNLFFTSSDPRAVLDWDITRPYTFTLADGGVHTFSGEGFEFRTAGFQTFEAVMGNVRKTSAVFEVLPGPIKTFNFGALNIQTAGLPFELRVENAVDDFGNPADGTVQISFTTGDHNAPSGQAPSLNPIIVRRGSGSAYQTLVRAETLQLYGQTAGAAASALTTPFTVQPGALTDFKFSGVPSTVQTNAFFPNPVTVSAYDGFGNLKTNFAGTVSFNASDPSTQKVLPAPTSFTGSNGAKTLPGNNFKLITLGDQYIWATWGSVTDSTRAIRVTGVNNIRILRVFAEDSTVSQGQSNRLVKMEVQNNSPDPFENFTASLNFRIGSLSVNGDYSTANQTGSIPAGGTVVLSFDVNVASNATLGTVTLDGQIVGTYKGTPAQANNAELTDTWVVQRQAQLALAGISVQADSVSRGSGGIPIVLTVRNNEGLLGSADARIIRSTLGFHHPQLGNVSSYFTVTENPAQPNPTTVPGAGTVNLRYQMAALPNAPLGSITVTAQVEYQDANIRVSKISTGSPSDVFTCIDAPSLQIVAVQTSQAAVTQGQTAPVTISVAVRNLSTSPVTLNLNSAKTKLQFLRSGQTGAPDLTVASPTALRGGGTTLPAGEIGYLDFTLTRLGADVPAGNYTIFARVESSDGYFTGSDQSGVFGVLEVQTPDDVVITRVTPSQASATVNDATRVWTIVVEVANRGGSEVVVDYDAVQAGMTDVNGNPVTGFTFGTPYLSRDAVLSERESDVLTIPVIRTGGPRGTAAINPVIRYRVKNTNQVKSVSAGDAKSNIVLQNPSELRLTRVNSRRTQISAGKVTSWDVWVSVENAGEAELNFDLADEDSSRLIFLAGSTPSNAFSVVKPTALAANSSTRLAGGARDSLLFKVTANVATPSTFDIKAALKAVEVNSSRLLYAENSVFPQLSVVSAANVTFQSNSLGPQTAVPGRAAEFQLTVVNSGQASVLLYSDATTFSFSDGVNTFTSNLDDTRGSLIPGNGSVRLYFQQRYLSTAFASGSYEPTVTLTGNENGVPFQKTLVLSSSRVTVGRPGSVAVEALTPSTAAITAGQSTPWTIDVAVSNSAGQTLRLKSLAITFNSGTNDVSNRFALQTPTVFLSGVDFIKNGSSEIIRTVVNSVAANTPLGDILLSARVVLSDSLDSGPLFEQQISNAAKVTVQSPAQLEVVALRAMQNTVTRGQTEPVEIAAQVRNKGGSSVSLVNDPSLTFLSFSKGEGNFTVQAPALFVGRSSVQLSGDSTDSLVFKITRIAGDESMLGETTVNSTISVREDNTGRVLTDMAPEVIRLTIQDSAKVRLDSLQAIIASGGFVNAGQDFYLRAKVTNVGTASADHIKQARVQFYSDNGLFVLADGSSVSVTNLAPGTSIWTPPVRVTAPSALGQQGFFRASLTSATARNTNGPARIIRAGIDTTEFVVTQSPPQFRLTSIRVDQDTVLSSSPIPWSIIVTVQNAGEGVVELEEPLAGDIKIFSENGSEESGYVIEPQPIANDQKRISRGASATLTFVVRETGKGAGRKTVRAAIRGRNLNNTAGGPLTVNGEASIYVATSSVVRLVYTVIDTSFNVTADGVGHVNIGQEFRVRVGVRNEGGRYLETVKTRLTAPASQVLTPQREITRLAVGAIGETTFLVRAAEAENLQGETLQAAVIEATGFDGSQAAIKEAVDATATVRIYRSAALRITATENLLPNPLQQVSLGQRFDIKVRLHNEGSETAENVLLTLTPSNNLAAVEPNPIYLSQPVAGGDSGEVVFHVQAGSNAGEVVFRSAISSARGKNSKQAAAVLSADGKDSSKVFLRPGADLQIVSVMPSVQTVNAGDRLTPWTIFVAVRNTGGADLRFIDIADTNITFNVGGIIDRDYKVLPPDGLEGSGTFDLRAGETDTLVYTVRRNGDLAGEAVMTVFLRAYDLNSRGELVLSAVGRGNVFVANNAALQIRETVAVAKREDENKAALVNRGQEFDVQVHLQTGQFGGVVNVVVELQSNGNSLRTALYDTIRSIGSDSIGVAVFRIKADDSWSEAEGERRETFKARIVSALAKGDLTPIVPRQPARGVDEVHVRIQVPAQLSYRLQLGEYGGTWVQMGKKFTVLARMRNLGTAEMGVGRLQLTPPPGYAIEREPGNFVTVPVEKPFSLPTGRDSMDVRFTLLAPEYISGPDRIEAALTEIPPDKNVDKPVLLGNIVNYVDVRTDSLAMLTLDSFVIEGPQGAVDGIISTEQSFMLRAVVKSSRNIENRRATLTLPYVPVDPAYELKSPQIQNIENETDTLRWELTAPLLPVADPHDFTLTVTGGNPADTLYIDSRSLTVQRVQQRAVLALEPIDIEPAGVLREGVAGFTQSQTARIITRVRNFGQAGYTGNGRLTLDLSRSGGFVLINGDVPNKYFTDDSEVSWQVMTPPAADGTPRKIIVRMTETPQDENAGVAARVTTMERELTCVVNRGGNIVVDQPQLRTIYGNPISAVSTEQPFQVAAKISTYGVKDGDIKATLVISSPEFVILDAVKFMPGSGENMLQTWTVTAPAALPSVVDSCFIRVEAVDLQSERVISAVSRKIALPLVQRSLFTVEPIISFPRELETQDKVSTDQVFHLTAVVRHSGASFVESDLFRMRLSTPPGFQLLEGETAVKEVSAADYKNLGASPTWRLQAPPQSNDLLARFSILVEGLPRDINSYLPSKTDKEEVIFPIRTVKKAQVKLGVYVHDEPGNDSTSVRPGNIFKLTSRLENLGEARLTGNYRLLLEFPPLYELVDRDTLKTTDKDTVSWRIRAPRSVSSIADTFTVTLLSLPLDEFARTPATLIGDSSATALVWIETGKVMIKTFPVRQQTAVVRGSTNVPIMGIVLQNREKSSTTRSWVTGMTVTMRDKQGKIISPKGVIQRLAAVRASDDAHLFGQAVSMADSGSIFLNFRSFVMDTLIGDRPDSIKLVVDLREQAPVADFRLTLDSTSAVTVVDQFSLPLTLVDSTGTVLSYLGFSSPTTVLVEGTTAKSFYNFPNPFGRLSKPTTSFIYYLKEETDLKLSIYTLTGDLVYSREIKKEQYPELTAAGLHQGDLTWDGRNGLGVPVVNGVYLAYLKTGYGEEAVTKIAVVR